MRALVAEGFDVLSFGRISWKKGLDRLIQAMVELPNVRALIAGNDEDGLSAKLRGAAEDCPGLAIACGFCPGRSAGRTRRRCLRAARAFALPSLSENFGNVVAEAMIRGLPVVVTERVGAAEIVKASGGGLVARSGPEDFAVAFAGLLASKEQLAAMGAKGAAYARERLTWSGIARRFEDLYTEIAGQRSDYSCHGRPVAA